MTTQVRQEVVVVGGGIAGLCAAYELTGGREGPSSSSPRVTVIEAGPRVGGKLQSLEIDGRVLDSGPDGVLARRPEIGEICRDLGIADDLVPIGASGASLFARGRVRPLPEGLQMGIPTNWQALRASHVLSGAGLLRALRDRLSPLPSSRGALQDRTIGSLVETKLGREVVTTLVDPLLGGINAGRVSEMSAAAIYPPLLEAGQQRGSLMAALGAMAPPPPSSDPQEGDVPPPPAFVSLLGGMSSLISVLETTLRERGVTFVLNTSVTSLRRTSGSDARWSVDSKRTTSRADGVVLALPAGGASELFESLDPDAAALLAQIDYASVAIVTFVFDADDLTLPASGTGVLIPPETPHPRGPFHGERFLTTALTFLDRKWPHLHRPGTTVLRSHTGRIDDDRLETMSDTEVTERALIELGILFDDVGVPRESHVTRWAESLPQYRVNHLMRVVGIENAVEHLPGLEIAGAALRGIGVPACIGSGRAAGQKLRETLTSKTL